MGGRAKSRQRQLANQAREVYKPQVGGGGLSPDKDSKLTKLEKSTNLRLVGGAKSRQRQLANQAREVYKPQVGGGAS